MKDIANKDLVRKIKAHLGSTSDGSEFNYNMFCVVEPLGLLFFYNSLDNLTELTSKRIYFDVDKRKSSVKKFKLTDTKAITKEVVNFRRTVQRYWKLDITPEEYVEKANAVGAADNLLKTFNDFTPLILDVNLDFIDLATEFCLEEMPNAKYFHTVLILLFNKQRGLDLGAVRVPPQPEPIKDDIEDAVIIEDSTEDVLNVVKFDDKFDEVDLPEPKKLDSINVPTNLSLEDMIAATVRNAVKSSFTSDMLTHVLHKKLNEYGIKPNVKKLVIENKIIGKNIDIDEITHKMFPKVLKYASLGLNIFLTGESGSGKTYCAELVGKALNLNVYTKSVGIETGMHEFMGYNTANGAVVKTDFQKAYSEGGVYLIDEIDGGNPNVLLAINQALSSESCTFASGKEMKHKNFVCIAAANTWGFGATAEYVGRNPIDGATLDRFIFVEYNYDEDMEQALSNNDDWVKEVQAMRANAKKNRVKRIISPRASYVGATLLANGVPKVDVLKDLVFKGMTEDEINLIKA